MKNFTLRLLWILAIGSVTFGMPQAGASGRPRLLQTRLESIVRPRARDCGHVPKDAGATVVSCVRDAINTTTPFYASFTQRGIDSEVIIGLALSASGTVVQVTFDGDPSGGSKIGAFVSAPVACVEPQFNASGTLVQIKCK